MSVQRKWAQMKPVEFPLGLAELIVEVYRHGETIETEVVELLLKAPGGPRDYAGYSVIYWALRTICGRVEAQ